MTPSGCCTGTGSGGADIALYQGDDWLATVDVLDGTGPADLSGYTANAQIRREVADLDQNVAAEITTQIIQPNTIVLSLLHDVTATLSGNYVWDLELIDDTGVVETILHGAVTVTQEVTREAAVLSRRNGSSV